MNTEWVMIGVVTSSAALFAIGGIGFKFARRFIMPLVLATGAALLGITLVRCLIALPLMIGAMCLGYGENHPLWQKTLTIIALGLCLLPLANGLNGLLILIVPLVFGTGYWLSRKFNFITWKLVELATGFSMGSAVVLLALTG